MDSKYNFKEDLNSKKKELYNKAREDPRWPDGMLFPTELLEARALKRVECDTEEELNGDPDRQERFLEYLWEAIVDHQESVLSILSELPEGAIPKMKAASKKKKWSEWLQKLFERRLNVVEFIINSWAYDSGTQVRWQQLAPEWNKAHPADPLNPRQMKTIFNRGIRDKGLMVQLLAAEGSKMIDQSQRIYQKLGKPFIPVSEWDSKSKEPLLLRLYKHAVLVDLSSQGYDVSKKMGFKIETFDSGNERG